MKKWEYKMMVYQVDYQPYTMNSMGNDMTHHGWYGWEMIHVQYRPDTLFPENKGSYICLYKRQQPTVSGKTHKRRATSVKKTRKQSQTDGKRERA